MSEYKKYCYWVDGQGLKNVRKNLEEKKIELRDEARVPCRVLRQSVDVALIAPPAWNGFCKRRTSWYRRSEMAHKFLIVSNLPLDLPDLDNPIIIMDSNFKPNRFPSLEEISHLLESQEYQKRRPSEWDKPDPLEKDFYQRWFERRQEKELFDFGKILLRHSANHANFLTPKFYAIVNGAVVPYSIADSMNVCSSCLEFFNILGNQWPTKYVVPCIGAVQFAHLPIDQYFEVRILPHLSRRGEGKL